MLIVLLALTLLAFDDPGLINQSKIAILVASLVAGTIGYIWLRLTLKTEYAGN